MPAPQTSNDLDAFVELESAVWDAMVRGDRAADAAALDDDFVGLYPTGYSGKAEHVAQLDDGPTVSDYALEEQRLIPVSDDAALLCYLATYRRGPGAAIEQMYVSSLWQRTEAGTWRNTFSQDTPASGVRLP